MALPVTDDLMTARLGAAMEENDGRQDYVRATLEVTRMAAGSLHPLPAGLIHAADLSPVGRPDRPPTPCAAGQEQAIA